MNSEGDYKRKVLGADEKEGGERGKHVEHSRILESLAISRDPLVPSDRLAFLIDFFEVPVEPTLRWGSRELPEGRSGTVESRLGEEEDKSEERGDEEPQKEQPKHLAQ